MLSLHSDILAASNMPLHANAARVTTRRTKTLCCTLALLFAAAMASYHLGIFVPNLLAERARKRLGTGYALGNDIYPIWLTTREWLLRHRNPYSPDMTRSIQTGLFGRAMDPSRPTDPPTDYRTFSYPAYTDLFAVPIATLSFPAVRLGLAFVLPIAVVAGLLLWLKFLQYRPDNWLLFCMIVLTLFSFQLLEALFAQQVGLLVGFLIAASMAALRGGRQLLSGWLLGLSIIKPQLGILLILCLLIWALSAWATRWLFSLACIGTMALLLICSIAVWGNWLPEWLAVVQSYKHYGTPPLVTDLLGPYVGPVTVAILLAGAAWLAWSLRNEPVDSAMFAFGLSSVLALTSITLLPGHALYDQVILLPGILLLIQFRHQLWSAGLGLRVLLASGALALFWQWIFAAIVVLAKFLLPSTIWNNIWFLRLPIRTVGTVPFAVTGLLVLALRELRRSSNLKLT